MTTKADKMKIFFIHQDEITTATKLIGNIASLKDILQLKSVIKTSIKKN